MLDIYAGKTALEKIKKYGFTPELFSAMFGASGGPKWFTLLALDKYIFGEFFKDKATPVDLVGSSAGAFRFAALSQQNPVAAITRLAETYSETVYSAKADRIEITDKAKALLDSVYSEQGIEQSITNPIFKPHFIVAKCAGLTSYEHKLPQMLGLISSMILNRINRGLLAHQYQRFVFQAPNQAFELTDQYNFNTQYTPLNSVNYKQALLASGSIPMVMQGVKHIENAPEGMYRDGGIIDYHFDVALPKNKGLTLFPHFNDQPKPGWFDKNLSRSVTHEHYDNVVMLSPSKTFIDSLPYGKIPDRNDFTELDANTRIKYWRTVFAQSELLAESLAEFIQNPDYNRIIPLS
ncbi:patatin-like phospholipase family protein [Thalassotalea sediminis]|uniref:patatin-like phospholipase family protein n=1 Tax=Thalassotalea sediminis TaxID=1759089 RepID=UPI002572EB56|nr:patatin-like phospholipase family protein [Thalassotalea sediminis]